MFILPVSNKSTKSSRSVTVHLSSVFYTIASFAASIRTSVSTTIPCPGHDKPQNFTSVPLTDRPKLAKILQHGWDPSLITKAVDPTKMSNLTTTTEPLPMVDFRDGFVGRPFRIISQDACHWQRMHVVDQMECFRSSSASFSTGFLSVENHFRFQTTGVVGSSGDPKIPKLFDDENGNDGKNKNASFVEWGDTVRDFLDCNRGGVTVKYRKRYGCTVNPSDCRTFDPEFLRDLNDLPIADTSSSSSSATAGRKSMDGVERGTYQAFLDKWGYGSVDKFDFGAREILLYPIFDDDPQQQQQDRPFLHLGRTGGSKADFSSDDVYTEEECSDPSPSRIYLKPWDLVLENLFLYDRFFPNVNGTDYAVTKEIVEKMDALVSNFYDLRWEYPFFGQHFQDFESLYVPREKCQATATPSTSPSVTTAAPAIPNYPSEGPTNYVTSSNTESDSDTVDTSAATPIPGEIMGFGPKFWVVCNCFMCFFNIMLLWS